MKLHISRFHIALIAAAVLLSGCAASKTDPALNGTTSSSSQCQSKWVASGNNGPKAGMYGQADCQ